jgi:DNA-binding NarL/FixJ family response regulator
MEIDRRPRIAVLSDDRLFCEGLLRILAEDESVIVIGYDESGSLEPALHAANPDVLLLDSRMPGALRCCTDLRRETGCALIMLAAPDSDEYAAEALDAGARGVLSKDSRPTDLFMAIRIIQDGGLWARRRVLAARIDRLAATSTVAHAERLLSERLSARLSARETEVFLHAARGLGNKEVADRLAITEATVKVHLTHIFQKLGLRGRNELAAAYHGILPQSLTVNR